MSVQHPVLLPLFRSLQYIGMREGTGDALQLQEVDEGFDRTLNIK